MKFSVTQRGFERFDLLPIRPTEGLLDSGEGTPHLNTNETRTLAKTVTHRVEEEEEKKIGKAE